MRLSPRCAAFPRIEKATDMPDSMASVQAAGVENLSWNFARLGGQWFVLMSPLNSLRA
jgi:hypothetical protein